MKISASRKRINEKSAASTSRSAHGKIFTLGLAAGIAIAVTLPAIGQGVLAAMDREAAFEEARLAAHLARLNEDSQERRPAFTIEETRPVK